MLIGKLNVAVSPFTERTAGPNGRKRTLTRIFVRMGNEVIAERVSPGKWDEKTALAEFKRFPDKFTPRPTFTPAILRGIAA